MRLPAELHRRPIQRDEERVLRTERSENGSWLYAELSGTLKKTGEKGGDLGKLTLAEVLHIPRGALAAMMAVLLTAALVALERLFPQ